MPIDGEPGIPYTDLKEGFALPTATFRLEASAVADYLKAVGDDGRAYGDLVPPLAVAAFALKALSSSVVMLPGLVYTEAKIELSGVARVGDTIKCFGKVSRKVKWDDFTLLTLAFSIQKQSGETIMKGGTGLILPTSGL